MKHQQSQLRLRRADMQAELTAPTAPSALTPANHSPAEVYPPQPTYPLPPLAPPMGPQRTVPAAGAFEFPPNVPPPAYHTLPFKAFPNSEPRVSMV